MMGMFDSIMIYMTCPKCGVWGRQDFQTKDLDCCMYVYHPLPDNWETSEWEKQFRQDMPCFPSFPLDKECTVWKDQAERTEAQASLGEPYASQLKYVNIYTHCDNCKEWLKGKIEVKEGKLVMPFILDST